MPVLGWPERVQYIGRALSVVLPLAIALLAYSGYYYSAIQLSIRVLWSAYMVTGGIILYYGLARWLVLARQRLAMARVMQRRETERVARERAGGEPDTGLPMDVPEIELGTIRKQTESVLRIAAFAVAAAVLLTLWADVLPALGVLDRVLWHSNIGPGPEPELRTITIGSILASLLIGIFTVVSTRSLPGLLEVSVLRGLPLDSGSKYAVSTLSQYVVFVAGLIGCFRVIGIGWAHVQWLVAAVSVGLGFGLQEIFANFVSGIIILLERPIRLGDTVTIGDVSGTVTRIRIRATTVTDWNQKELIVPNKSFITGQLINWSLSNPVTRLILPVGIAYGSDTELALRLMTETARAHKKVLDDPEAEVFFVGFGDSSLNFEIRIYVKDLINRMRTRVLHDLHMAVDAVFREHHIVIAFPQMDLHIKSDERVQQIPSGSGRCETPKSG